MLIEANQSLLEQFKASLQNAKEVKSNPSLIFPLESLAKVTKEAIISGEIKPLYLAPKIVTNSPETMIDQYFTDSSYKRKEFVVVSIGKIWKNGTATEEDKYTIAILSCLSIFDNANQEVKDVAFAYQEVPVSTIKFTDALARMNTLANAAKKVLTASA